MPKNTNTRVSMLAEMTRRFKTTRWSAQTVSSAIDRLAPSQRKEIRDKIFQIDIAELGSHHGAGDTAA